MSANTPKPTIPTPATTVPRLGLRPCEAAKALGIGRRLLWELTNRNKIPHLRLGRAVVYPVGALQEWLSQQSQDKNK